MVGVRNDRWRSGSRRPRDFRERQRERHPTHHPALSAMKRLVVRLVLLFASVAGAAPRLESLPRMGRVEMKYEPGLEDTARELQASADATLQRISEDLVD